MKANRDNIKKQILAALSHVEGEDGLYLNNLLVVHEEEERPVVSGTEAEVKAALSDLVRDGLVEAEGSGDLIIYTIANR